jgi:hypothetical protein
LIFIELALLLVPISNWCRFPKTVSAKKNTLGNFGFQGGLEHLSKSESDWTKFDLRIHALIGFSFAQAQAYNATSMSASRLADRRIDKSTPVQSAFTKQLLFLVKCLSV